MHLHSRTYGRTARLAIAAASVALLASAMPAQAAAPGTYAPGDVVTQDGASVIAPAPGHTVAISVTWADAPSTMLVVSTDASGRVTVGDGTDAVNGGSEGRAPDKCDDSAYSLIDGSSWPGTYQWNYRSSTTPNELTKKAAVKGLKQSVNNITKSSNGCGLPDQVDAKNKYRGSTSQESDVTRQLTCKSSPGAQNVTEFGPMDISGVLAATCTYSNGSVITDADVRINTGFEWDTTPEQGCSNAYGLQAVQTHEYGHAFGLGHVEESAHGNLTMSTNINSPCSNFEAKLGRGDVLALRDLY